jgi:hypothetical protein
MERVERESGGVGEWGSGRVGGKDSRALFEIRNPQSAIRISRLE